MISIYHCIKQGKTDSDWTRHHLCIIPSRAIPYPDHNPISRTYS